LNLIGFSTYCAGFYEKKRALKLQNVASELLLLDPNNPGKDAPPWRLDWCVFFNNGMHFRIKERYSPLPHPNMFFGQRETFSYQYGPTTTKDPRGWPRTLDDKETVIRIDVDRDNGPHLNFKGSNHIPQNDIQGKLVISELQLFDFVDAVHTHRLSREISFEEILEFQVNKGGRKWTMSPRPSPTSRKKERTILMIVFAIGEGLQLALDRYLGVEQFSNIKVIGVTFPQGTKINGREENNLHIFPEEFRAYLKTKGIPLVRANLPFDSIIPQHSQHGVLAQDLSIVGNALNVFGGGMSLCIQAVLLACDAGEVGIGEHVIAMTADTALIVRSAPTRGLLTELIVRQLICKPVFLTISKKEKPLRAGEEDEPSQRVIEASSNGNDSHLLTDG
jgi:hypothetical protein